MTNKNTYIDRMKELAGQLCDRICDDKDIGSESDRYARDHMIAAGYPIPDDVTECDIYYAYVSQYTSALLTQTASMMIRIF